MDPITVSYGHETAAPGVIKISLRYLGFYGGPFLREEFLGSNLARHFLCGYIYTAKAEGIKHKYRVYILI